MARPKKFDPQAALVNSMQVFWRKGYTATSVKDLENATGLVPSSLYNAFGNKEALFLQILEHYAEKVVGKRIERYLNQKDPIKSIVDFFTSCFTDLADGNEGLACLLVNSTAEVASHHKGVHELINNYDLLLQENFLRCVEQAKREQRISDRFDSVLVAEQLSLSLNGLLLKSRVIRDNDKMLKACHQSLTFILGSTAFSM